MTWRVWTVLVLAGVIGGGLGLIAAGSIAWPGSRVEHIYGGAAVGLVAASLTCLLAAAGAARWEGRGPAAPRRSCRECGAGVPAGAAICAWCGSADLSGPGRGGPARRRAAPAPGAARPDTGLADALPVTAFAEEDAGVVGGWVSLPPSPQDAPALLRLWSCALLVFGSPAVAVTTAAYLGPGPGGLAFLSTLGAGAAIARWGPGEH